MPPALGRPNPGKGSPLDSMLTYIRETEPMRTQEAALAHIEPVTAFLADPWVPPWQKNNLVRAIMAEFGENCAMRITTSSMRIQMQFMQNMLERSVPKRWTMMQEQHQQPPSRRDIPSRSGAGTKRYDKGFQDSRHPGAPEKLEEKSQDDKKQLGVDTPTDAANYQKEDEKKEEDQREQEDWLLEARDPGAPLHGAMGARATDEQHFEGVEQRLEEAKNLEEENLKEEEEENENREETRVTAVGRSKRLRRNTFQLKAWRGGYEEGKAYWEKKLRKQTQKQGLKLKKKQLFTVSKPASFPP